MRKAMSISLVLVLALSATAFARPVDQTLELQKFQVQEPTGPAITTSPGVFSTAQPVTWMWPHRPWAWLGAARHSARAARTGAST